MCYDRLLIQGIGAKFWGHGYDKAELETSPQTWQCLSYGDILESMVTKMDGSMCIL